MQKTDRSKIKVYDHNEWDVGRGTVAGGVTGAVIGIIAGTILLPAAIGALIGSIIGGVYEYESSFDLKELRKFGE